jgi:hypothetical protein
VQILQEQLDRLRQVIAARAAQHADDPMGTAGRRSRVGAKNCGCRMQAHVYFLQTSSMTTARVRVAPYGLIARLIASRSLPS